MSKLARLQIVVQEGAKLDGSPPSCRACAYSFSDPGPPVEELSCWGKGEPWNIWHTRRTVDLLSQEPAPHCPDYINFKQHPQRSFDGSHLPGEIGTAWPALPVLRKRTMPPQKSPPRDYVLDMIATFDVEKLDEENQTWSHAFYLTGPEFPFSKDGIVEVELVPTQPWTPRMLVVSEESDRCYEIVSFSAGKLAGPSMMSNGSFEYNIIEPRLHGICEAILLRIRRRPGVDLTARWRSVVIGKA